jgi:flagellar protein FlaG
MDVNFSHIGQNLAQASLQATPAAAESNGVAERQPPVDEVVKAEQSSADKDTGREASFASIETAVAEISDFVETQNRSLRFSIDEASQRSVVKVTDAESGDVIRQIPSDEVLKLAERIQSLQSDVGAAVGVLFNREV